KVHAGKTGGNHIVDCVAARAADPDHGDPWLEVGYLGKLEFDAHDGPVRLEAGERIFSCMQQFTLRIMAAALISTSNRISEALAKPLSNAAEVAFLRSRIFRKG